MNTRITTPKRRPPSVIESERLLLRKPRIEDAETIYLAFSEDHEVNNYMDKAPSVDLAETCRIIARFIRGWETLERFEYVIVDKNSNDIVGMIGVCNSDTTDNLAYAISQKHIGKHYLNEAVTALINSQLHIPTSIDGAEMIFNKSLIDSRSSDRLTRRFERTLRHKIFNKNHNYCQTGHLSGSLVKAS